MALARDLREQEELKGKVVNAMTYPLIILAFLVIAIIVVMVYVIPQLIPIITQVTTDLPLATELLIFTSNFIRDHFVIIFLVFIGVFLIIKGYISTEGGKYRFDNWKLTLPIIGKVYRNYLIVRIMSTLSLLLTSGITILKTLKLTGSSANNLIIEKTFVQIIREVSHGKKIHESLKEADPYGLFFDNSILQMIESGEKTSTLNIVAEKLAVQYRREVDTSLAIMVKLIEPIALLVA
jgi:MSHA biogenesis protein MshG